MKSLFNYMIDNPNKPILFVAFVLLAALFATVVQAQDHPRIDPWGNIYPELCRTKAPIGSYEVRDMYFDKEYDSTGRVLQTRYGAYWRPGLMGRSHVIGVNALIRDKMTHAAVVLHERCHLIMWEQTGSADWH